MFSCVCFWKGVPSKLGIYLKYSGEILLKFYPPHRQNIVKFIDT